jgi:hypothetical protein
MRSCYTTVIQNDDRRYNQNATARALRIDDVEFLCDSIGVSVLVMGHPWS